MTVAERQKQQAVAYEKGEVSGHMTLKIRAPEKEGELNLKVLVSWYLGRDEGGEGVVRAYAAEGMSAAEG
jgi:hypothetical protein